MCQRFAFIPPMRRGNYDLEADSSYPYSALILLATTSRAQSAPDAQVWLTTVIERAAHSPAGRSAFFRVPRAMRRRVKVNDMQQYQPIDGFGFALTGGSAQLLMQVSPARRDGLLRQLLRQGETGSG